MQKSQSPTPMQHIQNSKFFGLNIEERPWRYQWRICEGVHGQARAHWYQAQAANVSHCQYYRRSVAIAADTICDAAFTVWAAMHSQQAARGREGKQDHVIKAWRQQRKGQGYEP